MDPSCSKYTIAGQGLIVLKKSAQLTNYGVTDVSYRITISCRSKDR